jgi:hypothetical protein
MPLILILDNICTSPSLAHYMTPYPCRSSLPSFLAGTAAHPTFDLPVSNVSRPACIYCLHAYPPPCLLALPRCYPVNPLHINQLMEGNTCDGGQQCHQVKSQFEKGQLPTALPHIHQVSPSVHRLL